MAKRRGNLELAIDALEQKKADAIRTYDLAIGELKAQLSAKPARPRATRSDLRKVAPTGTD